MYMQSSSYMYQCNADDFIYSNLNFFQAIKKQKKRSCKLTDSFKFYLKTNNLKKRFLEI